MWNGAWRRRDDSTETSPPVHHHRVTPTPPLHPSPFIKPSSLHSSHQSSSCSELPSPSRCSNISFSSSFALFSRPNLAACLFSGAAVHSPHDLACVYGSRNAKFSLIDQSVVRALISVVGQTMGGAPRYAPADPSLPHPWRALVDVNNGYLYYWNPESNITQYDKPGGSTVVAPPPAPPVNSRPNSQVCSVVLIFPLTF